MPRNPKFPRTEPGEPIIPTAKQARFVREQVHNVYLDLHYWGRQSGKSTAIDLLCEKLQRLKQEL
jgi:hypothetical protein